MTSEQLMEAIAKSTTGYGNEIQEILTRSGIQVGLGPIYSKLKRLRKQGLIDSIDGDCLMGIKRQHYYLTDQGKAVLMKGVVDRLEQQWRAVKPGD